MGRTLWIICLAAVAAFAAACGGSSSSSSTAAKLGSAEVRALRDRFPAVRYTVATRELSLRPAVEPPATRPGVHQGLELLDAILDIRREIAA